MRHRLVAAPLAALGFAALAACGDPAPSSVTPEAGTSPSPAASAAPSEAATAAPLTEAEKNGFTVVTAKLDGKDQTIDKVVNRMVEENQLSIAVGGSLQGAVEHQKLMLSFTLFGKERNPTAAGFTSEDLAEVAMKARVGEASWGGVANWLSPKTNLNKVTSTVKDGKFDYKFEGYVQGGLGGAMVPFEVEIQGVVLAL